MVETAPREEATDRMVSAALGAARALRDEDRLEEAVAALEPALSRLSPKREPFLHNLVLNEIEISRKKTVLFSKPRQLGLTLTHRCNIRCKMCFYPTDPWDMPEERVEEIYSLLPTLESVFWQGGEAFVSKHFKGLFREAVRNPYLQNTIVTNGLLIDDEWAEIIVSSGSAVVNSIDGGTKETYEEIRRWGRWEALVAGLDALNRARDRHAGAPGRSSRFDLIFQMTVMKENCHELREAVEFARRHRFTAVNFLPIQNIFGPENIFHHKDREALDKIREALPAVKEACSRYGLRLHVQLPLFDDPAMPAQGPQKTNPSPEGESAPSAASSSSKPMRVGPSEGAASSVAAGQRRVNRDSSCYWPWLGLFTLLRGATKPYGWCCENVEYDLAKHSLIEVWNNPMMQRYRELVGFHQNVDFCDARCTSGVMPKNQLGRNLGRL